MLEWEIFQTKVVDEIKTHILCSVTFSRKSCRLRDNVEKNIYGTFGRVTDDDTRCYPRRMRIVCCIPKATNTHSEYVTLIGFPRQQWLGEKSLCFTFIGKHAWLFYITWVVCVYCAVQTGSLNTTDQFWSLND